MKWGDAKVLAIFLLLQPSLGVAAEQAMGRFFFTPEQRARMDVARQQEHHIKSDPGQQESELPAARLTLNGVIARSDGKTTLWINNQVESGLQPRAGMTVQGRGRQVTILTRDGHASVPLKVGQSVDMNSGQVEEGFRHNAAPPLMALPEHSAN